MEGSKQSMKRQKKKERRKLRKGKKGKRKRKLMYSGVYLLIELGRGHFSVSLREDPGSSGLCKASLDTTG